MKQIKKDGKIEIHSPYVDVAPARFRQAGGKWSGSAWIFNEEDQEIVDAACEDIYGVTGREETTVAEITVKTAMHVYRNSVVVAGFALAIARGRDSGAKVGDGVQLKSGKVFSSGSMKNWTSNIEENSIFIIKEFPINMNLNSNFEIKYLNVTPKANEEKTPFDFSKASDSEILEEARKRNLL